MVAKALTIRGQEFLLGLVSIINTSCSYPIRMYLGCFDRDLRQIGFGCHLVHLWKFEGGVLLFNYDH